MASLNLNVAGTWKQPKPWVNVSGTWKAVKAVWVNVAGTWKQVYASLLSSFSIVAGTSGSNRGYVLSTMGSITGATVAPGISVTALESNTSSSVTLTLSGFSSAPAQSYFTSLAINGGTPKLSSAALSFSTTSTTGTWEWSSFITFVNGNSYTAAFT